VSLSLFYLQRFLFCYFYALPSSPLSLSLYNKTRNLAKDLIIQNRVTSSLPSSAKRQPSSSFLSLFPSLSSSSLDHSLIPSLLDTNSHSSNHRQRNNSNHIHHGQHLHHTLSPLQRSILEVGAAGAYAGLLPAFPTSAAASNFNLFNSATTSPIAATFASQHAYSSSANQLRLQNDNIPYSHLHPSKKVINWVHESKTLSRSISPSAKNETKLTTADYH